MTPDRITPDRQKAYRVVRRPGRGSRLKVGDVVVPNAGGGSRFGYIARTAQGRQVVVQIPTDRAVRIVEAGVRAGHLELVREGAA